LVLTQRIQGLALALCACFFDLAIDKIPAANRTTLWLRLQGETSSIESFQSLDSPQMTMATWKQSAVPVAIDCGNRKRKPRTRKNDGTLVSFQAFSENTSISDCATEKAVTLLTKRT
jgi:hypothetical protein